MNLKRNINGCRKRESYSFSFFLINQLLMINNPKFPKFPKFSRISVFRAFSLYQIQIQFNISFTAKSEHHVSFIIAFIEIEFRGVL
ncbi:hypothetical protein DQC98_15940 [Salmonella enterica subsp. enterica serovar Typhimurium]|nr:hypothetical protein [Salmonella enterica subsp. enterica serovar Typhimurium]MCL6393378.1 hypothetical protein [Pectobacterium atrosepticum]EBV0726417.1 hypothetical protein [Salmonella enterica subsp. enterica serovar Typhimurium]EBW4681710.1 hypothetical protein [Salmonella enterica subsp. enterica serovar Typhimurium]EBW6723775.1 hypothetical protein [Salmonella enterica subsp. enterica serovar Typhimurium]